MCYLVLHLVTHFLSVWKLTVMVCVFIRLTANILASASPAFYRGDNIFSSIEMIIQG